MACLIMTLDKGDTQCLLQGNQLLCETQEEALTFALKGSKGISLFVPN